MAYYDTDRPAPQQRPACLSALGIINIVFAALGVFGILSSLVLMSMLDNPNTTNPVLRAMQQSADYRAFTRIAMVLSVPAIVVLLVAGIGLLRMKPWGRSLSIIYAIYGLLMGFASLVATYLWLVRPMLDELGRRGDPVARGAAIGGVVGGLAGSCFSLIYPVILLVFMFRRSVIEAIHPERARRTYDLEPTQPGLRQY